MTKVATAPEQARADADQAVSAIRDEVQEFMLGQGGRASLSELLAYLEKFEHGDARVSRAITSLLAERHVVLTSGRDLVLVAAREDSAQ